MKDCIKIENEVKLKCFSTDGSVFLCDFFLLAQELAQYFTVEKVVPTEDNDIIFYTSEYLSEIYSIVENIINNWDKKHQSIYWIDAVFDTTNCKDNNEKYQKLNWVLEEIYAILIKKSEIKRCSVGKIIIKNDDFDTSIEKFYNNNCDEITKFIENEEQKAKWFDVNIDITGTKLSASIDFRETNLQNPQFYFYLIKNSVVIDRQGWMADNKFSWELNESGIYCVQGFVKIGNNRTVRYSKALSFYDQKAKDEFTDFVNTYASQNTPFEDLSLVTAKEPFANFIVVSGKGLDNTNSFTEKFKDFNVVANTDLGDISTSVLSTGSIKTMADGNKLLFSGVMRLGEKIAIGIDDIPADTCYNDINSSIGNNSSIYISSEEITLGADFFNLSHWFYYESEELKVAANSYHALLLFLKECGIALTLDTKKAAITLSSADVFPLMQNFTRKMDIENVYQLELNKEIHITANGWKKITSECGQLLKKKPVFHESEYKVLLKAAAKEILKNVQCVIDDDRFKYISSDLTGGLDSRIIYSALTSIPNAKNKVKIVSNPVKGSQDLEIATEINSIFGFEYDDFPQRLKNIPLSQANQTNRSFHLGTYFSHGPLPYEEIDFNHISLNGGCGEIVTRPIYARKYFDTMVEQCQNARDIANYTWTDVSTSTLAADSNTTADFISYLEEELKQIPVESLFEKYDKFYLFYRNMYHFNDQLKWRLNMPVWMPIQSKAAFALHHYSFLQFKNIKFELDLIATLNPLLTSIRFDSNADNADYIKVKDCLAISDPRFKNINISGKDDMERWEAATYAKRFNKSTVHSGDTGTDKKMSEEYSRRDEYTYAALLNNFCELMKRCPTIKDRIGVDLYHAILRLKGNSRKVQFFYNKITSLLDQLKIADI